MKIPIHCMVDIFFHWYIMNHRRYMGDSVWIVYGFYLQYDVNAVLACSPHVLSRIKMCMQWISCEQNSRYDLTWELSLILDSGNEQLAASLQASWESVLPPSPIRFQQDSFQYFSHACRVPTWKDTTKVQTCMKKYFNQLRSPQRQTSSSIWAKWKILPWPWPNVAGCYAPLMLNRELNHPKKVL